MNNNQAQNGIEAQYGSGSGVTGSGGGILASSGGITVNGSVSANDNTATNGGGAFAASGNVNLAMTSGDGNVVLTGNQVQGASGSDGGAVWVNGNATIGNASGTLTITGNSTTDGNGGAIWANGNVVLNASGASTISGNTASNAGGAIWAGGNLVLNASGGDLTFSGNTASGQANAIWLDNTAGGATATFNAKSGGAITFYDPIASNVANGPITVLSTGPGTVLFDGSQYASTADRTSDILANTTVQAGTFQVDNGAVYGATGSTMTVASGGTLGGNGTIVGNTTIASGGILKPGDLTGAGALTINGNAALNSGATATLGGAAQLAVTGTLTQGTGSTLNVTLDSGVPAIIAGAVSLQGTLNIAGVTFGSSTPSSASALGNTKFTVIQTTGGISGNFASVTLGANASPADYLTVTGAKSANNLDYTLGLGLTWNAGTAAGNGTFTLTNATDTFNVDVALTNQAGPFTSGWNGQSLIKGGAGTLTLSAQNSYTGLTTISAGTLALSGGGSITQSSGVLDNGTLDISGTTNGSSVTNLAGTGSVRLGSQTLTLTNASGSFSGVIGGNGGLTLTGGTETLTGANTYSGTTNVASNSTLDLSGSGSIASTAGVTDSGTINIASANALGGTVTINAGGTLALTGAGSLATSATVVDNGLFNISGANGSVALTGLSGNGVLNLGANSLSVANTSFTGTLKGTGSVNFTGATNTIGSGSSVSVQAVQVSSGSTLDVTGTGSLAQSSGVIDNGTLDISGTTNGSSVTNLAGTGTVNLGNQTLTLTNASGSFSGVIGGNGGLTLTGGTETLTGANTFSGATTISSGTLALSGGGSIAQSSGVLDNGTLDISGTTNGSSVTNLAGTGTVNLGNQTLTLTNASGTTGTFSGTFTGTGKLLMSGGSGSQIFDGNNSSFTGTTEITSGLLEVGDINTPSATLGGDVLVDAAGTLRGHGTVEGSVTNNGTVMPGGTIGTLTVGGNYTQASNATLSIEVSPTAASQLLVSGGATLGGTLAITYDPGTYSAKTYTLVSAKSVTGTFSNTTSTGTANLGALTPSLGYTGTAVDLTLSAASTPGNPTGTTPGNPAGSTPGNPAGSTPGDPVLVAPTGTSIYTALGTSAILGAQAQGAALLDRMQRASSATPATPNGWITATGVQTEVDGTNSEPGFQANRYGFLAGLERTLGDYTVGVAAGYDHTDIDESVTGDSGSTDTLRAALYGSRFVGPVNLAATVGLGLDFLAQKRPFGSQGTAEGDHTGQEANVGSQASLPMTFGDVTVTPRVGLRYAYFHANGFGESGAGGQDLNVGTDNVHSLQPYAGVTLDKAFGDASKPTTVQFRLGYAHELLDVNRAVNVMSQDGTLFTAPGTNLPRGYLTTGASVTLHPAKSLDVSLSYDTVIDTGHASAQLGSVRVGYQF